MFKLLDLLNPEYDVVVIGAGVAGLSAALFGVLRGAKVLLVESTDQIGGTTSYSGGTAWVPCTHHDSGNDNREKAKTFIRAVVGNQYREDVTEGFLESGPAAIRLLEDQSEVKFVPYARHPDYEQDAEGAVLAGRALMPKPYNATALGRELAKIRKPIPEMTIFNGLMLDANDIKHFLGAFKSPRSFAHVVKRMLKHGADLARFGRTTHLVNGNALVARFLASLRKYENVDIVLDTTPAGLDRAGNGEWKLTLSQGAADRAIIARRAVVMAAGGFNRNPQLRERFLPGVETHSPAAPGAQGGMQALALEAGARYNDAGSENAFWAPVSIRERADGTTAVYPHFLLDRSKPGSLCVNASGQRFVNEATSYHNFARAMMADADRNVPAFMIMDVTAIRKYGLGIVKPRTRDLSPFVRDGYLIEAGSIAELAQKLGIDQAGLETTVERMNAFAKTGEDADFGKGTTAYHRHNGDPTVGPNPCLGPIEKAPFYAVRLYPGDIGAATGIVTDNWARVLSDDNSPIQGLYACGNEAQSMMGGTYPGPGITIGPAIVFAYRAIEDALGQPSVAARR